MASHRNSVAKQSLKQRRANMLCSRLDRINNGKTYGGTYFDLPVRNLLKWIIRALGFIRRLGTFARR